MSTITKVYDQMRAAGWEVTPGQVQKTLEFYLNNAPTKIPHFSSQSPGAIGEISAATGIDKTTTLRIMLTVETMAQDGVIPSSILFPDAQTDVEQTISSTRDILSDTGGRVIDKTTDALKQIKWIGVLGIVGIGVWLAWPHLKKIRG